MAVHPPVPQLPAMLAGLTRPLLVPPPPGGFSLEPVPAPGDPLLGPAVLHYCQGLTRIYCSGDQVTPHAAGRLSLILGQAFDAAPDPGARLTVITVGHDTLPAELHPAAAITDEAGHVTCYACSDVITPGLAGVLGALWTAHVAYLLDPGRRAPVPAQLPADVADFTGREDQVRQLFGLLSCAGAVGGTRPARVAVIAGDGGLGKTALAVHVAHLAGDSFPDGHLYADLLGGTAHPLSPGDVLAGFARDLGAADQEIPLDEDGRAAMYRARLAGRRVLIVLDNARDAAQVRPLLPDTASCAVLITARARPPGLPGAALVELGPLPDKDAYTLFARLVGDDRAAGEPGATATVLQDCAGLPLAIRICAARLAARGGWTLRSLASRLAEAARATDGTAAAGRAIRSSFGVSFASLPASFHPVGIDPARAFRLLGLWQGASIPAAAAAALFGTSEHMTVWELEVLVDMHLLGSAGPGRYQFHDPLRDFAAGLAEAGVAGPDRGAAARRLLRWYLRAADAAACAVAPDRYAMPAGPADGEPEPPAFAGAGDALAWYDSERVNLVAATSQAAQAGWHDIAWRLAAALSGLCERRGDWAQCIAAHRIALDSARLAGDRQGEAWVLDILGRALSAAGQDGAAAHLEEALAIRQEIGDAPGQAQSADHLGHAYARAGRHGDALRLFRRARTLYREAGSERGEAAAQASMAQALLDLGRAEEALRPARQACSVFLRVHDPAGIGAAMRTLAQACMALGRYVDASDWLRQSLVAHHAAGNLHRRASTLRDLAHAQLLAGEADEARESLLCALAAFTELGDEQQAAQIRAGLSPAPWLGLAARPGRPRPGRHVSVISSSAGRGRCPAASTACPRVSHQDARVLRRRLSPARLRATDRSSFGVGPDPGLGNPTPRTWQPAPRRLRMPA